MPSPVPSKLVFDTYYTSPISIQAHEPAAQVQSVKSFAPPCGIESFG